MLTQFDVAKRNMNQCAKTLSEASNWNHLVSEAERCLEAGELAVVSINAS